MVKQINIFFILIIHSFIINQELIEVKEFTFFKHFEDTDIDFNEIVDFDDSIYKIELIAINSIKLKNVKKTIIPKCEVDIFLNFPSDKIKTLIKPKDDNSISASVCNGFFKTNNSMFLSRKNSFLEISTSSDLNNMEFELVFWVTGKFKDSDIKVDQSNHGYLREWHENGKLYIEYKFNNGKKNGLQKKWYPNGQQEILYHYNDGKLTGTQKKWHENGVLKFKINYQYDLQHGRSEEWFSDGSIKHVKIFNHGVMIEQIN